MPSSPPTPPAPRGPEALVHRHLPLLAQHLHALEHALHALRNELETLALRPGPFGPAQTYHQRPDHAWQVRHGPGTVAAIAGALQRLTYDHDDQPNQSHRLPGALGVPHPLLDQVHTVNALKARLKAVCVPLHRYRFPAPVRYPDGTERIVKRQLTTLILARLDRSDVNLLAAYRQIPVIPTIVRSLTHTHYFAQSVPRATVRSLIEQLEIQPSPLALQDLSRLRLLDPREHLVSPKARYARLRARASHPHTPRRDTYVYADLPVLFLVTARSAPPVLHPPRAPARAESASDPRIEPDPVVHTLNYYRRPAPYRTFAPR